MPPHCAARAGNTYAEEMRSFREQREALKKSRQVIVLGMGIALMLLAGACLTVVSASCHHATPPPPLRHHYCAQAEGVWDAQVRIFAKKDAEDYYMEGGVLVWSWNLVLHTQVCQRPDRTFCVHVEASSKNACTEALASWCKDICEASPVIPQPAPQRR